MDSNIKEMITSSVKELSRIGSSTTNLVIWGGLGVSRSDGSMFVCQTDGAKNILYGVRKHVYKQWKDGSYVFNPQDMENTKRLIGITMPNGGSVVSDRTRNSIRNGNESLIKELTFFLNEVYYCSIDPKSKASFRDSVVIPAIHDIEVDIIDAVNSSYDTKAARVVLKSTVDPDDIYTVPKGGGTSPGQFDYDELGFNFDVNTEGIKGGHNLTARIEKAKQFQNKQNQYGSCHLTEKERPRIGDTWYNGLRSSIGNGIYELWADDIGAGPMLRASRSSVQEAAARYKKDINPTNQRYASTRVNPVADKFASNAITPVKIYIENWWEDPQVYAGIIAALFALMRSTGDNRDSFEFSQDFIDAGAFDYDKMYKPLNGTEIS